MKLILKFPVEFTQLTETELEFVLKPTDGPILAQDAMAHLAPWLGEDAQDKLGEDMLRWAMEQALLRGATSRLA